MFIVRIMGTLFYAVSALAFGGLSLALLTLASANIQLVLKAAPGFITSHADILPWWLVGVLMGLVVLIPLMIYSISYAKLAMVTYHRNANGVFEPVGVPMAPVYSLPMFKTIWDHAWYRVDIHLPYWGSTGFARFSVKFAESVGIQLAGWHQTTVPWAVDALAAETRRAKMVTFVAGIYFNEQNPMLVKISRTDWEAMLDTPMDTLPPLLQKMRKAWERKGNQAIFALNYAIPAG